MKPRKIFAFTFQRVAFQMVCMSSNNSNYNFININWFDILIRHIYPCFLYTKLTINVLIISLQQFISIIKCLNVLLSSFSERPAVDYFLSLFEEIGADKYKGIHRYKHMHVYKCRYMLINIHTNIIYDDIYIYMSCKYNIWCYIYNHAKT